MSDRAAELRRTPLRSRLIAGSFAALLAAGVATRSAAQEWEVAIREGDFGRARTALEAALAAQPNEASLRYELARVLGYLGSAEAALAELDALLAEHPDNADYVLGRAQMLARLGRDAEALAATEHALRLAPDYEDVWRLRLALVERASDGTVTAVREQSAARFPGADWWQRAPAPIEYTRWISIGSSQDRLSGAVPDWSEESVRLDWMTPTAASFHGEIARAERFDRVDSSFSVGGAWLAVPQWRVGGALTTAADAAFEPSRELALEAQRSWSDGWGTALGHRRREYSTATVTTYSFTGDKYFADYRVAYRVDYSHLLGSGSSTGHSLILGWYPTQRRSLGVMVGAGEEIETVGLDQLQRTRVSSVTFTGRQTFSARLGLSWWLGTHRQGDFYRRRYGGVSVRIGI
jgi:YaiO family outer membrane protein